MSAVHPRRAHPSQHTRWGERSEAVQGRMGCAHKLVSEAIRPISVGMVPVRALSHRYLCSHPARVSARGRPCVHGGRTVPSTRGGEREQVVREGAVYTHRLVSEVINPNSVGRVPDKDCSHRFLRQQHPTARVSGDTYQHSKSDTGVRGTHR